MLTIMFRRLVPAVVVLAALGAARQAEAQTKITFDDTITSPIPPTPFLGLTLEYDTPPVPPGPEAFFTQGFAFGGRTIGVTPASTTRPEFDILLDATLCPSLLGIPCLNNGTKYLVVSEPFSLSRQPFGAFFRVNSFDAGPLFGGAGCPPAACGDEVVADATTIQVSGFRAGLRVAHEVFTLSSGFQTFALTDPDWVTGVTRVVIQGLNAAGNPTLVAIDNISADPVAIPSDYDGDAKAELAVYRPSTGQWFLRFSSNQYSYATAASYQWGLPGDTPLSTDFDGDRKTDLAVYRPSNGTWYVRFSSSQYSFATFASYQWGLPGDIPLSADFDGDAKTDLAVYRPSTGQWFIRFSTSNYSYDTWTSYQWGLPGDIPLSADFDGDGRADLVVYRPSTGEWFVRGSASNYSYTTAISFQWGLPGDTPLSTDFDGDGRTDLVVYRPSNGTWYVRTSSQQYSFPTATSYQWGLVQDVPVPNDFDGDGRTDLAVYRPSTGEWFIRYSTSNYSFATLKSFQWGLPTDLPLGKK